MSRFFSSKHDKLVPYVPGEQPQGREYMKLNTNESPFPPSPLAQKLGKEAVEELNLYSDPDCRALVEAGAAALQVEKDQLLFTNGSDEILNFAFMAFCDEAHPAVFPDVTYDFYSVFAELNGVPYETIPVRDDFSICVEDYIGIGKNIFIANPNAPSGISLPLSEIERIVASNPDNVVVIDEAYVDFGGESAKALIGRYDNLLVTQTCSKSRSLAGARLGMGIACRELIADLINIKFSTNPYNVNRTTAAAGIGALMDVDYFNANCAETVRVREKTKAAMKELGFVFPDSRTNFVFAAYPGISGAEMYALLKEKGVLVRHFNEPRIKDYNRITIGTEEQMEKLMDIFREIIDEKG